MFYTLFFFHMIFDFIMNVSSLLVIDMNVFVVMYVLVLWPWKYLNSCLAQMFFSPDSVMWTTARLWKPHKNIWYSTWNQLVKKWQDVDILQIIFCIWLIMWADRSTNIHVHWLFRHVWQTRPRSFRPGTSIKTTGGGLMNLWFYLFLSLPNSTDGWEYMWKCT